jgi:hypothetical protein
MAYGGMRGEGPRIGERPLAREAVPSTTGAAGSRPGRADLPLHCWVHHEIPLPDRSSPGIERAPGVLVEWRHEDGRWWGLVVFVCADDAGRPVILARLLPAEVLAPA